MEQNKSPWLSKTLWMNALMAVSAFMPGVGEWLKSHPDALVLLFMSVNMVLRLITKDKLTLG